MKALVGAFNQEKALVGAFSVIVQPVVEPMEQHTALAETRDLSVLDARLGPGSRRMMAKVVLPVVPVFSFLWFEDKVTRYLDNTHYFCICTTMSQMIV